MAGWQHIPNMQNWNDLVGEIKVCIIEEEEEEGEEQSLLLHSITMQQLLKFDKNNIMQFLWRFTSQAIVRSLPVDFPTELAA